MIIDFVKCMRVPKEDTHLARESVPYRCPVCATQGRTLTPQTNSGKLRFGSDPAPICGDHDEPVVMEAVNG